MFIVCNIAEHTCIWQEEKRLQAIILLLLLLARLGFVMCVCVCSAVTECDDDGAASL